MKDMIGLAKAFEDAIFTMNDNYKRGFYSLPKKMQQSIGNIETYERLVGEYIDLSAYVCAFLELSEKRGINISIDIDQLHGIHAYALGIVGVVNNINIYEGAEKERLGELKKLLAHMNKIVKSMED